MADRAKDLLLSRVSKQRPLRFETVDPIGAGQISRRDFLRASGSAALLAGTHIHDLVPHIVNIGQAIEVHYGGGVWSIDPAVYGSGTRLKWQRQIYDFQIQLTEAVLPGTNLRADFIAILFERFSEWYISLRLPRLGFRDTRPLADWIRGGSLLRDQVRLPKIAIGGGTATFGPEPVMLSIDHSNALRFGDKLNDVTLTFGSSSTGSQLLLRPQTTHPGSLLATLDISESAPNTSFSLLDPKVVDVLPLGRRNGRTFAGLKLHNTAECCGEAYHSSAGCYAVTLLCGEGSVGRICERTNLLHTDQIQLEHAALLKLSGSFRDHSAIAGRVSPIAHRLDFGSWSASIKGDDTQPLYARFGDGCEDIVQINASLANLTLPIEDADSAQIKASAHPISLIVDGRPPGRRIRAFVKVAEARKDLGGAVILTGDNPIAALQLEESKLTIRRSVDLLNLSFSFEGFDMRISRGVPVIRMRRSTIKGQRWVPANLGVHFPPQHIAEKWFSYQDPSTIPPSPQSMPSEKPKFSEVEPARLSGESRIVFHVEEQPRKRPKWIERPLTVQALTDWNDLAISVNERALGPNKTIEEQLAIPHIEQATLFGDAIKLAEASLQPPRPRETALEMTGRLIFSPSGEAKWDCPRGHVNPKEAVLWHAKLDRIGRQSVRALWSDWMVPGQFLRHQLAKGKSALEDNKLGLTPDPLLVLSPDSHWNIVAQTSLYGMMALRGSEDLEKPSETRLTAFLKALKQFVAPTSVTTKRRIPRNRVVTPKSKYQSLEYLKQDTAHRSPADNDLQTYGGEAIGFALVEPFEDANIIMTSLGGSLAAEWNGEPFAMPVLDERLPTTFNLERFIYRSQLGRDVHVETYDKGYLLPLGIRASYVELSERRFFPHPKYSYPVAYLVKRTFIVIRRPEKRLPAVDQQYDSRDFPAARILMLTKTTPDLRSPKDTTHSTYSTWSSSKGEKVKIYSNGRLLFSQLQEEDLVFWPRITDGPPGTRGDVEFRWTLDDDQTPNSSNLLFVSNSCSHNPGAMRIVAEYYRALGKVEADTYGGEWSPLRKARLFGTRRRYATEKPDAETAFDTDSWLLSLRGASDLSGNNESFVISEAMERGDQPPFFPIVEKARIAVQSLDRLLGSPQGLLEVQFYQPYVASGFDGNRSEIFLEVLHPLIRLNVNNHAGATGGLCRTNAKLAALSRTTGFVGGEDRTSMATAAQTSNVQAAGFLPPATGPNSPAVSSSQPGTMALVGPQPHPSTFDFTSAEGDQPRFNPGQFFDETATLLGLVKLRKLFELIDLPTIDKAPKLLETVGYGPSDLSNSLASLQPFFADLALRLTTIKSKIDTLVGSLGNGDIPSKLTFEILYPALALAITDLSSLLNGHPAIKDLGTILSQGQRVLAELQRVIQDPVPELARRELATLGAQWASLKDLPNDLRPLLSNLVASSNRVFQGLTTRFKALGLQSVLLGTTVTTTDDMASVLSSVEGSLYTSMLALPLAAANRSVLDLQSAASRSIDQVARSIQGSFDALNFTVEFGQVAEAGSALANWSKPPLTPDSARVVRFAYEIAGGRRLSESQHDSSSINLSRDDFANTRQVLRTTVSQLKIIAQNRPDLTEQLEKTRTSFLFVTDQLSTTIESLCVILFGQSNNGKFRSNAGLEQLRGWFEKSTSQKYVVDLAGIEAQVADVFRLRQLAVQQVQALAPKVKDLYDIVHADPAQTQLDQVQALSRRLRGILIAITSVEQAASRTAPWAAINKDLDFLRGSLSRFQFFDSGISETLAWAQATAPRLRDKILDPRAPVDAIVSMADECRIYLEKADKQIAGLGLQTAALPTVDARILMLASAQLLISFARAGSVLYKSASSAVAAVRSAIQTSALRPLISVAVVSHIDQIATDLNVQSRALEDIANKGRALDGVTALSDLDPAVWATKSENERQAILNDLNAQGARLSEPIADVMKAVNNFSSGVAGQSRNTLARALSVLDDVIDNALRQSVSSLIDATIRDAIAAAIIQLQNVLVQILPTRTDLAYNWDSRLPEHKSDFFSFAMDREEATKEEQADLSVRTNIKINFLKGDREATSESRLGPFKIALLGDLVTVKFHEALFRSANGSEPKLTVRFNTVVLGPRLNFLKALQSLLSPGEGNGPYLNLTPEILAVGYRYDAGVIQVGTLQFIHVSLHVFTRLPLRELAGGDLAAQIGFGFATEQRPFLIAAPPYGGGGYVQLLFAGGKLQPRISLSFGAVVAIQFGPLSGHGRVTSTITWGEVIRASVEAVGEGHLGCFGVAVMLQIALTQDKGAGNSLVGSAKYSFEFTVGFLSFSFSFEAHYTISGGDGQSSNSSSSSTAAAHVALNSPSDFPRLLRVSDSTPRQLHIAEVSQQNSTVADEEAARLALCELEADPNTRRIRIVAPQKSSAWRAYRDRLSMSLLED